MKAKLLFLFLAMIALAVGFTFHATREVDQVEAATNSLASQRSELEEPMARLEQRLRAVNDAFAKMEKKNGLISGEEAANVGANAAASKDSTEAKRETPTRRLSATTIIANDPMKMVEYVKNFRASLNLTYGGMFKAVGLSPEQIEKFKDAEVWLREAMMDLQAATEAQGFDANSTDYKKLWSNYQKARVTKKAEVLGDLTNRYLEYFRTQGVRDLAQELARTGAYSGESVTSAQVERAADILIANCKRRGAGSGPGWAEPSTINWDAATAQLKEVLSPAQIATLGLFIQKYAAQAKVTDQINRLTAQFKGTPPQ